MGARMDGKAVPVEPIAARIFWAAQRGKGLRLSAGEAKALDRYLSAVSNDWPTPDYDKDRAQPKP